jgi:hypothetical protein
MSKKPKNYWNHRVLAFVSKNPNRIDEVYFEVHEVHYKDGKPITYSEPCTGISGESYEEFNWQISKIQECLRKPVLDADNWPKIYKKGLPATSPIFGKRELNHT